MSSTSNDRIGHRNISIDSFALLTRTIRYLIACILLRQGWSTRRRRRASSVFGKPGLQPIGARIHTARTSYLCRTNDVKRLRSLIYTVSSPGNHRRLEQDRRGGNLQTNRAMEDYCFRTPDAGLKRIDRRSSIHCLVIQTPSKYEFVFAKSMQVLFWMKPLRQLSCSAPKVHTSLWGRYKSRTYGHPPLWRRPATFTTLSASSRQQFSLSPADACSEASRVITPSRRKLVIWGRLPALTV